MDLTPDVRVHIEELLLDGFAPGDRYRIGEAVEQELARVLAERGLPPSLAAGTEQARLDAGAFTLEAGLSPAAVGARIAQTVYGGW